MEPKPSTAHKSHAIVIGASMAGLLAARALAGRFDRVTVLERDSLADDAQARKGVPQGQHVHGLLKRGEQIIEGFLPGVMGELAREGALQMDMGRDMRWFHFDVWKARCDAGVTMTSVSRPRLEAAVRRRVLALPNVTRRDGHEVLGLLTNPERTAVIGVTLRPHGTNGPETALCADLVVDAGGRGSATPRWLTELGYERPPESQIKVQVGYASLTFRWPAGVPQEALYIIDHPRRSTRLGILVPLEGGLGMVTLAGMLGDHPPGDLEGFLAFAKSLPRPDVYQLLRGLTTGALEALGQIRVFKFPANLRRHYEKLRRRPAGLLVVGDAACSFNPFYGQGMTMAALGAEALAACLSRLGPAGLSQRPGDFQRALARATELPWSMTTGEDLRFPEVSGPRTLVGRALNAYMERLHAAASHDEEILRAFVRVMHMLAPPLTLLTPRMVLRVLRGAQRPQPACTESAPLPA